MKKPTQKEKIVDLLSDGEWHCMRELNDIGFGYGQRLAELKKIGYKYEKKNKGSHYWYRHKSVASIMRRMKIIDTYNKKLVTEGSDKPEFLQ